MTAKRAVKVAYGNSCPKCGKKMIRWGHPPSWKPKPDQPYWFRFWDRCFSCKHIQHYEIAKETTGAPA